METYVALLRGINVGGRNKLPMKDLTDRFAEAGGDDIRTYIQSGNVIFQAEPHKVNGLPAVISARIAERFGYRVPVVLRSLEQLRIVIQNNPFLAAGESLETLHVMFLAGQPSPRHIGALDPDHSVPDRFVVRESEIYLHLPRGMAETKLTNAYFDSKLATVSTARNWRTVTKLLEMMEG